MGKAILKYLSHGTVQKTALSPLTSTPIEHWIGDGHSPILFGEPLVAAWSHVKGQSKDRLRIRGHVASACQFHPQRLVLFNQEQKDIAEGHYYRMLPFCDTR